MNPILSKDLILLIPLLIMSYYDIREKQVELLWILVLYIMSCIILILNVKILHTVHLQTENIMINYVLSILLLTWGYFQGVLREADILILIGIQLSDPSKPILLSTLFYSLLLCVIYSIIRGKYKTGETISFIPFITAGYSLALIRLCNIILFEKTIISLRA